MRNTTTSSTNANDRKKPIFLIRSQGWRSQMFYIVITTETGYTELIKFPNVRVGKEHFQMEGSGKACLVRNGLCLGTAKCVSVAITSCIWGWTLSGLGIQRCYKSVVLASCSSLTGSTIIKLLHSQCCWPVTINIFIKPKCFITTSTCVWLLGSNFLTILTIKFSWELLEANQLTLKGGTNT